MSGVELSIDFMRVTTATPPDNRYLAEARREILSYAPRRTV
jgi:hypothetical protein